MFCHVAICHYSDSQIELSALERSRPKRLSLKSLITDDVRVKIQQDKYFIFSFFPLLSALLSHFISSSIYTICINTVTSSHIQIKKSVEG
jgi:hypothetical protein